MSPFAVASTPNVTSGAVVLPRPLSIDGGPDTGSFLPSMRNAFPDAATHLTVKRAFENITAVLQGTLVGHGLIGRINAGQGGTYFPADPLAHLGLDNEDQWRLDLAAVPGLTLRTLVLFGCGTGANADGAQLLFDLAKALNATVQAPTGDVWLDDSTGEPKMVENAVWQKASPDMSAPPTAIPHADIDVVESGPSGTMLVFDGVSFVRTALAAIRTVRVTLQPVSARGQVFERDLEGVTAVDFVRRARLHAPIVFGGRLATLITGSLVLRAQFGGAETVQEFRVHNNRLLEGVSAPGVFYRFDAEGLGL